MKKTVAVCVCLADSVSSLFLKKMCVCAVVSSFSLVNFVIQNMSVPFLTLSLSLSLLLFLSFTHFISLLYYLQQLLVFKNPDNIENKVEQKQSYCQNYYCYCGCYCSCSKSLVRLLRLAPKPMKLASARHSLSLHSLQQQLPVLSLASSPLAKSIFSS